MKKKMAVLLAAVCAISLIGGCGGKGSTSEGTDAVESTDDSSGQAGAITYDVENCVQLGEYMGLEVSLGSYEVTEESLKSTIESTLASYPSYEDTDKTTVEEGDVVNIDYEGLKDGVAFEGGTAQGSNLEIGSNSFIDGFEDGLIGKKVGEDVKLDLTFPEDYGNEELAGQAVVFNVKINKIVNEVYMTYDTMTDEFVTNNFVNDGYKTVDEMIEGTRKQLESNNETNKQTDTEKEIFKQLHESCTVTLPDGLLDQRIQEYKDQYVQNIKNSYNMELADYLGSMGMTEEQFNDQVHQYIEESLTNQFILEAIAKKEKIEADEEGYTAYKKDVISDFGFENEDALLEQYGEDYVKNAYISDKTLNYLIENAKITYDSSNTAGADADSQDGAAE